MGEEEREEKFWISRISREAIFPAMMELSRLNIFTVLVILNQIWTSGGEDSQIKILTRPQTFQRPINSNITLPCSVRNLDGSVVTWSKDGQVISADNFKVLKDSRITVNHL